MPKIFETKDRHESHIALEYIRGERKGKYIVDGVEPYPGIEKLANKIDLAECREDMNETLPFQIWDEVRPANVRDPDEDVKAAKDLDAKIAAQVSAQVNTLADSLANAFAAKLAERMKN